MAPCKMGMIEKSDQKGTKKLSRIFSFPNLKRMYCCFANFNAPFKNHGFFDLS